MNCRATSVSWPIRPSRSARYYHPALTAVCADLEAEVEAAFTGLADVLDKKTPFFKTEIPMRIIERDSVNQITPDERI